MGEEIVKELLDRLVKRFMDIIVLGELNEGRSISGYDCIGLIRDKFHICVSSGKVYSLLGSMERDGLIEGKCIERKRVYTISDKGRETIGILLNANNRLQGFIRGIFRDDR